MFRRFIQSDLVERAAKTAVQTFVAIVTVDIFMAGDLDAVKQAAMGLPVLPRCPW